MLRLFGATNERSYLEQALQNARGSRRQSTRGATHSDRLEARFESIITAAKAAGLSSGNMTFILRLYDALLAQGYEEFSTPAPIAVDMDQAASNTECGRRWSPLCPSFSKIMTRPPIEPRGRP